MTYNLPAFLCPTVCPFLRLPLSITFVCTFLCLPTHCDLSTRLKTFYPSLSHYTSTVPTSCHFTPAMPSSLLSLSRSYYHERRTLQTVCLGNVVNCTCIMQVLFAVCVRVRVHTCVHVFTRACCSQCVHRLCLWIVTYCA